MSVQRLTALTLLPRYATNRNDLVAEFYDPCLSVSTAYDRAVGYFRSSVLLLAAESVADFSLRGGKIRLVCSPELTAEDIEALESGYEWRKQIGDVLSRSIEHALDDEIGRSSVTFLATLVAVGSLDLKIAFRLGARGIFHDKVGVFRNEDGDAVSFTGSSNETFNAWDATGNHEAFDVFCSWTTDGERVKRHLEYFESLWHGNEPGLDVVRFPDVARERLIQVADRDGIKAAYEKVARSRAQSGKRLQAHQKAAIESWKHMGRKGILEHATGSGKTISAIAAIREWLDLGHPALVIVPSQLLLDQWRKETSAELQSLNPKVLLAGGGNTLWRKSDAVEGFTDVDGGPRLILATLQTASNEEFYGRVRDGEHLLVVVDEVHRAGSPQYSRIFSIDAGARLGLSATPRRFGDPGGTKAIYGYFGGIIDPPFTLDDAIAAGRLCRYNYHVHRITLNEAEMSEWRNLTEEIKREFARTSRSETEDSVLTERAKILLIRRARILKNASAKVPLAAKILQDTYETGQRWLVYCDSQEQLDQVLAALRKRKLPANEYHSAMLGDPGATLNYFSTMGGILVAIRMLDEGVDIPAVDHALILASSRNPREFIQRRGRVLRVAKGKYFAEIHDVLVVPSSDNREEGDVAILRGEIARAIRFASSAANKAVVYELRRLALEAGVDPGELVTVDDVEEDTE